MAKYLGLFVSEASDHLAALAGELVRLEASGPGAADLAAQVDGLFRHAHSLKGMAAAMELDGIAALAHRAEDLVGAFRARAAPPDAGAVDVLLSAVDALAAMVEAAAQGDSPAPAPELLVRLTAAADLARGAAEPLSPALSPLRGARVDGAAGDEGLPGQAGEKGTTTGPAEPPPVARHPLPRRRVAVEVDVAESCPVPSVRAFLVVKKLSRLGSVASASPAVADLKAGRLPGRRLRLTLDTAEPLAALERTLSQISDLARCAVAEEAPAPAPAAPPPREARPEAAEGGRTVRVKAELLDAFLDTVGELILATARLRELGRAVPEDHRAPLEEGVDRLQSTVKDLHDKVMTARMTPLASVAERLPRAARDLARRTGKQVEVEVRGAEIEVDRAILDDLGDPLTHLLRNAVDHGLEAPHLRLLAGKPATGRITISARRERDRVLVEVADDGKGMDPAALRASAVERGALDAAAAAALDDRDALLLACLPGVSTADGVTEVSGRGVGMDAVKRAVEALGGALDVESAPGVGTRWTLRLPLTLAVQPVLLVRVAEEVLGLPISKVHGAAQVDLSRLERSQGAPVLPYDGRLVPVRELAGLLGFERLTPSGERSVVVADGEGGRIGLAVDALLGQQEAVLKPLSRPLDLVPGLSAVTVLGSGRPVFILDVQRLVA